MLPQNPARLRNRPAIIHLDIRWHGLISKRCTRRSTGFMLDRRDNFLLNTYSGR